MTINKESWKVTLLSNEVHPKTPRTPVKITKYNERWNLTGGSVFHPVYPAEGWIASPLKNLAKKTTLTSHQLCSFVFRLPVNFQTWKRSLHIVVSALLSIDSNKGNTKSVLFIKFDTKSLPVLLNHLLSKFEKSSNQYMEFHFFMLAANLSLYLCCNNIFTGNRYWKSDCEYIFGFSLFCWHLC